MAVKHKDIDFRISRRILWVDEQAYPLSQVTRVRPVDVHPRRRRMVVSYGRKASATTGLGVFGLLLLSCLGEAVPPAASVVFALVVLAMLVAHTVALVRGLTLPTLYVLSVATAGSPHAALASTNKELIYRLSRRVAEAIDNPTAEFEIKIDHMEIVHGDKYGGDRIEGDKILSNGS